MKIGIDGMPLGAIKTGVGHYTYEITSAMAATHPDDEFHVVSPKPFWRDSTGAAPRNVFFIEQPVNSLTRHWWSVGLPFYIRHNLIDVFHGTNYDVPLWRGCPTVLTIHDLSLFLYPETHERRRVRRARRRLPIMARLATRIIVPTESVKNEVCEHLRIHPSKIVAIAEAPRSCFQPLSVETATPMLTRLGVERTFLLYVGAIEPRKNLSTLVRAFEDIYRTTNLRPQLVIAGPIGWLSDDFLSYIKRSSVSERVLLTGYVDDEDLRALYSVCSVMCFPALYEGAGLPPLEAMACGAAVITSNAPAIAEMVGDGAYVFSPRDHYSLARLIVTLLTETTARSSLIQRGLKHVKKFSWEQAAAATYEIYQAAIAVKPKG